MRTRFALLAFAALVAPGIEAQSTSPTLSPESQAILGGSGGASSLDADVVAVLGRPQGEKPSTDAAKTHAVAIDSKLRCPVCQGVSIADSPSSMATKMREQVRELVAQGYSEEQVLSYFERSYGEFVRLEPPLRGLNVMLWILPGLVLLGGALFVFRMAKAPVKVAAAPGPSAGPETQSPDVDPELAKYLERIRRDAGTSS
jgi:cytochrome c-type biogenesis protein CcmH